MLCATAPPGKATPPTGKGGSAGGSAGAATLLKAYMSSRSGWAPGGPSSALSRGTSPAPPASGPAAGSAGGTGADSCPSPATTCPTTKGVRSSSSGKPTSTSA
eukprot:12405408-Alexandrium_andersonii.AAC.1